MLAKLRAREHKYNPDLLKFSDDTKHKLMYDGIKFGANGYYDFIMYSMIVDADTAEKKRTNYRKRAYATMQATSSRYSPASLSYYILW